MSKKRRKNSARRIKQGPIFEVRPTRLINDIEEERGHKVELSFKTSRGDEKRICLPVAALDSSKQVLGELRNSGWVGIVVDGIRNWASEERYLGNDVLRRQPAMTAQRTRTSGWQYDGTFVHQQGIWGSEKESWILHPAADVVPLRKRSGNAHAWKEGLKMPCSASSFLTFGIGVAFAGPILEFIGEDEGGIFNLQGLSSTGKSLTLRACQSVAGRAKKNDIPTFEITGRRLEETCASRNDGAVAIDELGRATGGNTAVKEIARHTAYSLAGGHGKERSIVAQQQGLPSLKWRTFGLSSSEMRLDEILGKVRDEGERVRMIDVPITGPQGIFDSLGDKSARKLAKQVEKTIEANHGRILEPYIRHLQSQPDVGVRVEKVRDEFIEKVAPGDDSAPARFAGKFGLVLAGMLLAADAGLVPWDAKMASKAVLSVYSRAKNALRSPADAFDPIIAAIERLRIEGRRLPLLPKGETLPADLKSKAWGFVRKAGENGLCIYIDPKRLKRLCEGQTQAFLDYLDAKHLVRIHSTKVPTFQVAVKGFTDTKRRRWYCLRAEALSQHVAALARAVA